MQRWMTIAALTACVCATLAVAQQDRRERIMAVPVEKAVTLDGDLKEWDLSGAIDTTLDEKLRPLFSLQLALMYDAEALYIGAHFVDDTPMMNRHDPELEKGGGWAGDCLQIHLCSDVTQPYPLSSTAAPGICDLMLWYYTDKKEPVLFIGQGWDDAKQIPHVYMGKDAGTVFKADPDGPSTGSTHSAGSGQGKGYTLEARIPWSRVYAPRAPKAGERMTFTIQPFWGDATGYKHASYFNDIVRQAGFAYGDCGMWGQAEFLAKGNLAVQAKPKNIAEQQLPVTTSLRMPDKKATTVSAAIYNASNIMVRTLLAGSTSSPQAGYGAERMDQALYGARIVKRDGAKLEVEWDGCDDQGKPLPAGDYSVKLLTSRGIGQKWIASLHNAGNPPWFTDDDTGSWGGDHAPPIAAATDAERVYLLWAGAECGPMLIACRPDGQKLWGAVPITMEAGWNFLAVAVDDKYVYTLQDGIAYGEFGPGQGNCKPAIARFDKVTGKPAGFPFGNRCLFVGTWPDSLMLPDFQVRCAWYDGDYGSHHLVPVNSRYRRIWEKLPTHNFGPQELGRNAIGLAVYGGKAYVTKYLEDKAAAFDIETGKLAREWNVARPAGIAATTNGTIYAVSGKGIVTLGPDGSVTPVVKNALSSPWGLAVGKDGLLYVSDCGDAMQVKVFDTAGKPVRAIGTKGGRPWVGKYDQNGMLELAGLALDRDNKLWVCEYNTSPLRISTWQADGKFVKEYFGPGAYATVASVNEERPNLVMTHNFWFDVNYRTGAVKPVGTFQRSVKGPQFRSGSVRYQFRRVQGRTYACSMDYVGTVIFLVKEKDGMPVGEPVAAWGSLALLGFNDLWPEDLPPAMRAQARAEVNAGQWHKTMYQWHDLNGNRLIDDNEWTFTQSDQTPFKGVAGYGWGSWVDNELTIWTRGGISQISLPVKAWKGDVPIYPSFMEVKPAFAFGKMNSLITIPDGAALYSSGEGTFGSELLDGGAEKRLLNGDIVWTYKRAYLGLSSPLPAAGDMPCAGLRTMAKTPDGLSLLFFNAYYGQYFLLEGDGLYVGALCKDTRTGPKCGPDTILKENFNGLFFRNKDNGKYYAIGGDIDARIWEVTGIDTLRKGAATLTIARADTPGTGFQPVADTGKTSAGEASWRSRMPVPLRIAKVAAGFKPESVAAWDLTKAVTWDAGLGRTAKVALARDDNNLYALYQVSDRSPMANAGKDWTTLFQGGDTCEIMLAADPNADPKRTKPAAGDMRILFSVMEGRPMAAQFEAVARSGEEQAGRSYVSLTGTEVFERVVQLTNAMVNVAKTHLRQGSDRQAADGYILSASVPLKDFGFATTTGLRTKGDVGVLFSNDGGTVTARRTYYFNQNTGITGDLPSEARLQPADWGTLEME